MERTYTLGGEMRAAYCEALGSVDAIRVCEVPEPVVHAGQVLVRVRAAAVNYPDVLMIAGRYHRRVDPPFVPGGEFAGEVVSCPLGWAAVGTRVTGTVPHGAFAEFVAADLDRLSPLPDSMGFEHGAAFPTAYKTAFHALFTIGAAGPGQVAVVTGAAGGVGLATVDVAHRLGLRVVAAASSPERLALCREYGADDVVDYTIEPLKERVKALVPGGADIVVDPVGGPCSEQALRALRWGGRFVTVGYAAGTIPAIPLNLVLLKGAVVRGFEMRGLSANLPEALEDCDRTLGRLVAAGMRPHIGAQFPLDAARDALATLVERRAVGKVVITVGSS